MLNGSVNMLIIWEYMHCYRIGSEEIRRCLGKYQADGNDTKNGSMAHPPCLEKRSVSNGENPCRSYSHSKHAVGRRRKKKKFCYTRVSIARADTTTADSMVGKFIVPMLEAVR